MRTAAPHRRFIASVGALAVVASSLLVTSPAVAADAPVIVITSPTEGQVIGINQHVPVAGHVSDLSIAYYFDINGWGSTHFPLMTGNNFSASVLRIPGVNTFTLTGGGTTATVSYFVDDEGPDVVVTSPAEGSVVTDSLSLDFTVGDGVATWVSWDGGPETLVAEAPPLAIDTAFLAEGAHQVRVRSVDPYDNSTAVIRNFTIDRLDPVVTIDPADGSWVNPNETVGVTAHVNESGTKSWAITLDGTPLVAVTASTMSMGYGVPAPGWAHGASHVFSASVTDAAGNVGVAGATVRADATAPLVSLNVPTGTLARASTFTGTASDTGSGVSSVALAFRTVLVDDTCGAVVFSETVTPADGAWSAALPPAAVDGSYCLSATATDGVGHATTVQHASVVVVDVTAPAAPDGLAPVGRFWQAPTELSWSVAADAVSYRYRSAPTAAELDSATIISATGTSVTAGPTSIGDWYWQVQGVDEHGNEGAWSTPQLVTVVGLPELADMCDDVCGLVGAEFEVEWTEVLSATGYEVVVRRSDTNAIVLEHTEPAPATIATLALPGGVPHGMITVQIRPLVADPVEGVTAGPWSDELWLLHLRNPVAPALVSPTHGVRVDGSGVELNWTDDAGTLMWELRLSSSPSLDSDGGLDPNHDTTEVVALMDPMLLLVLFASELPRDFELHEINRELDCEILWTILDPEDDPTVLPCANGSFTVPETLPDGEYYWQVRGYGTGLLAMTPEPGAWSAVGHFLVAPAPAPPAPPAPGGGSGGATGSPTSDADPSGELEAEGEAEDLAEDPPAEPSDGGDDASGGGSDAAERADSSGGDAGEGFPLLWVLIGGGALVVLAGAGFGIRFLMLRAG